MRRHNLSLILGQVHRDGAVSRAELTQRLGMNRSTIGALVADLAELGLVDEYVPTGGDRAGRPSHVVQPRPDGPYAVAIDVDFDRVVAASVGLGGRVLTRHEMQLRASPASPREVARLVDEAVGVLGEAAADGAWQIGVGVSIPGTVSLADSHIGLAPNLHWRDVPFGTLLAERMPPGLPVAVGNDADLAVLAEHLRGAARGCDDVIYLVGRVGVGAGIIVGGVSLHGHEGYAGEIGHTVFDASGPVCHCGNRGCVEMYLGEHALLKLAGKPNTADVGVVFADAHSGRDRAGRAVHRLAESLGRALASLVNLLNPQRVVIGGTLAGVLDFARDDVERELDRYSMHSSRRRVELCVPGLGADSSLLGAAELVFGTLLADPLTRR